MIGQIIAFKPRSRGGGSQLNYLAKDAHAPKFTDYHHRDALGVWRVGSGLAALGLSATSSFDADATTRLAEGFHAQSGMPLCRNAGADHRQGWDITIDDPKEFSLIHAFGDDAAKRDYYEARQAAWRVVVSEIELLARPKFAGLEGPVEIAMEIFEHDDSRSGDPHKHGHGFLFNVGVLPNGKTCAIDVSRIMASKAYLGQVYQSELARQFAMRGRAVAFEDRESTDTKTKTRYAVATIPDIATPEQIAGFSERAAAIAGSLDASGAAKTVKAKNAAALKTRDDKKLTHEEMREMWDAKAKALGLDVEQLHLALGAPSAVKLDRDERHARVISEIAELSQKAIDGTGLLTEPEIAFAAARALRGEPLKIIKDAATLIQQTLVRVEANHLGQVFTTKECLALEKRMKEQFKQMAQTAPAPERAIDQAAVDAASILWEAKTGHKLTGEQRAAASHIVCGPSMLANIEGEAGTGKSTLMEVAAAAWKANGMRVIGAAPTGKAAEALAMSLGEAETCARLLIDIKNGRLSFDAKTVLVIDECGMLASPTYAKLVNHATAAGAKLVCVGDRSQLAAIGMRGGFHASIEAAGMASITENRRQMKAVAVGGAIGKLFRQGKAAEALDLIDKEGRLTVAATESGIIARLAEKWIADSSEPMEKMVLAELVETVGELNAAIRDARKQAGQIGEGREVVLETKDGAQFSQELAEGDKILFLQNAGKKSGVIDLAHGQAACPKNGMAAIIEEIRQTREDSHLMTVRTEDGRRFQFETADYACFALGYAHSFHKSQGSTATNVYAVAEGTQVADLGLAYVGATRHKNDCHMFVTEDARDAWSKRAATKADARMVSERLQGAPSMPALTPMQAAGIASAEPAPPIQVAPIAAPVRQTKPIQAPESPPTVVVAASIFSLDMARKIVSKRDKEKEEEGKSGRSGRGKIMPSRKGHAVALIGGERLTMDLGTAAQRGNLAGIAAQIDAGAQIDASFDHMTALQRAATTNKPGAIKLLAELGANLEIQSGARSMTALHIAAAKGNIEACVALIESGAKLSAENGKGQRAAELAQAAGHSRLAQGLFEAERYFEQVRLEKVEAERQRVVAEAQRAMKSPNFIPPPNLHPRRPGPDLELGLSR